MPALFHQPHTPRKYNNIRNPYHTTDTIQSKFVCNWVSFDFHYWLMISSSIFIPYFTYIRNHSLWYYGIYTEICGNSNGLTSFESTKYVLAIVLNWTVSITCNDRFSVTKLLICNYGYFRMTNKCLVFIDYIIFSQLNKRLAKNKNN